MGRKTDIEDMKMDKKGNMGNMTATTPGRMRERHSTLFFVLPAATARPVRRLPTQIRPTARLAG